VWRIEATVDVKKTWLELTIVFTCVVALVGLTKD
jgi:hypothetical protein